MKYILCYGDSNTYGASDDGSPRYELSVRWPGVLQRELGGEYHIYENGLCGRTTVFDDPVEEGRCGKTGLPTALEVNAPLDAVVLMLGTNDCKNRFRMSAVEIGLGMELLVRYCNRPEYGRDGKPPRILVVAPAKMDGKWSEDHMATIFAPHASEVSVQLAPVYTGIAQQSGVDFFDASQVAKVGDDNVHLKPSEHEKLGRALADKLRSMLG